MLATLADEGGDWRRADYVDPPTHQREVLCFEIDDGRRARDLSREPGLDGVAIRGRDIDGWPERLSRITRSRSHNQGLSRSFALASAFLHSLCLPSESSASACVTTNKICAWACFLACSTDSRVGWCSS
jgi:hypothetical protein